jgi:hypothetical protein
MSYDFCIIGENGTPVKQVGFGVDEHHLLIEVARNANLAMLSRCSDYYADIDFFPEEIGPLKDEIEELFEAGDNLDPMNSKLKQLVDLCNTAMAKNTGISTIAD